MELKEIMQFKNFTLIGDTLNEEKYAYKIKHELIKYNYNMSLVYEQYQSLNEIDNMEVINLCINPIKGLKLLQECTKDYKVVLIQPGAESDDLINYLKANNIPFLEGCSLVGMKLYK